MKTSILFFVLTVILLACDKEHITKNCGTEATVRDLTGTDGCWLAFELNDGTRLIPVWDVLYCGTPPLPKEVTEDPLYNFQVTDGKKVIIGYELRPLAETGCKGGVPVKITCLDEGGLEE